MLLKNPVTPPGIDPGTVRIVARRLNHYATPGPALIHLKFVYYSGISLSKYDKLTDEVVRFLCEKYKILGTYLADIIKIVLRIMKFYFPAAVNINMLVFWIVTPCLLVVTDILRGTYYYCCLCILIVRPCILNVVHVFLLSSMYSYCCLCILIVVYVFLLFVHVFLTLSMYSYCCLCILIVRPCILNVVYVFLLSSMFSYCLSMYSYRCLCILIVVYVFLLSMYSYCSSMYS